MKLSVVSTLYRSATYIQEFHERALAAARAVAGDDFEIILVNDGSPDNSLEIAAKLVEGNHKTAIIDLSRNFGHHKAMMTGLAHSKGDLVFLIDSDLEEEPEWLLSFSQMMEKSVCDVVCGVQSRRRGSLFDRLSAAFFYSTFRLLTGVNQPSNILTARLMSRAYVEALVSHRERELNMGGLWTLVGFRQVTIAVTKHSTSPTTYSFGAKFGHFINAVTSFSSLPLVFTFYSGLLISTSALIYISYLVLKYIFIVSPPEGYTSLIASIWLFSGLIIFFIGIQGIYISKIFIEVKQRPYTIIRQIYRSANREEKSK